MLLKTPARQFVVITIVVFFASGLMLALALPSTGLPQQAPDTTASPTGTSTSSMSMRPGLAPPATRPGLVEATPEFATSVPLALTHNFDPAQFDLGRRTYTQWCATCHGDRGQGLALWRSSWDPDHQTCTKSGCHGRRAAPDGFTMLTVPPPLIGANSLPTFDNAFQLFYFIRARMPYQAPGTLSDQEYWAVTAFLADQHGGDASGEVVDEATAVNVKLH